MDIREEAREEIESAHGVQRLRLGLGGRFADHAVSAGATAQAVWSFHSRLPVVLGLMSDENEQCVCVGSTLLNAVSTLQKN